MTEKVDARMVEARGWQWLILVTAPYAKTQAEAEAIADEIEGWLDQRTDVSATTVEIEEVEVP